MAITYSVDTDSYGSLTADFVQTDPSDINNRTRGDTAQFDLQVPSADVSKYMSFDRHAGSYSLLETLDNTQKFKLQIPSSANINTLVVGLNPATELSNKDIAGKWGLVSNVTDSRTRAITNPVISLEIDILADYSEYAGITAVENDLEI